MHYQRWQTHGDPLKRAHIKGFGSLRVDGYRERCVNGVSILEHRLVMQKALGRPLETWEQVHHIDHDRSNNDPANLKLLTAGEHRREHATFRNATHKQCTQCREIKPRGRFLRDRRKGNHDDHMPECKDCDNARRRANYQARMSKTVVG